MRRPILLVALTLICCLGVAHARPDSGVVLVVGKATAKDRAIVASAVRSAARSGGWELVETPLAASEIERIVACLKGAQHWSCISPIVADKAIARLIVVRVEPERSADGVSAVALTEQVLLSGADVTTSDQRFCQKCVEETLTRIAFDLTKSLLEEAASGTGRTKLTITSAPPGAWITLDSTNVGLSDHTYATFPGRHVVVLQREGYETETRQVDVVEHQETKVSVALRAKGSAPARAADRPHLIPGVIVGAGVVALASGVALQRAKDPPDTGRQPRFLLSVPIVSLAVGGSVAIGVGVYLWMHATNRPAPTSMPTATVTSGGGIIGWTGHF